LDTLPGLIHPQTGRVHSSFRQAVAATGRISSSDPNLQNIPVRTPEGRKIREAFIAAPGYRLLSADYSQVELRVLAHYSRDPGLINSFADGADIHRRTAAEVFDVPELFVTPDQRRQAKAVNFGLMYGMSAFRLSNELRIPQKEARGIIKRYFTRYAGVKRYFDEAIADARKTQRATTLLGRSRHLPHINTQSFNLRQQSERLAVNTPIQGTAADILKLAMLGLDRRLRAEASRSRMLLTVHDELVLEVPEDEVERMPGIVREEMEAAMELEVPLRVDVAVGTNWAQIH
jgi:DNA polymerase-1